MLKRLSTRWAPGTRMIPESDASPSYVCGYPDLEEPFWKKGPCSTYLV